jgi:hypothetical protein
MKAEQYGPLRATLDARPGAGLVVMLAAALGVACNAERNAKSDDPPRIEQSQNGLAPTTSASTSTAANSPMPPASGAGAPVPGANGRPSIDETMGRGFQGKLEMRVHTPSGRRDLRYIGQGNTARLQVDGLEGHKSFDALIWSDKLAVLDNAQRSYRSYALDAISDKGDADPKVEVKETGERKTIQGVICERYEITEGTDHISACVSGLPGTFAVDKLEAVSGLDAPAWVERLVRDELLPLEATARDSGGREKYRVELLQYAPGPVDPMQVAIPENYRAETGPVGAR